MMTTIEIRHWYSGEVLFSHSCDDNTIKKTVEEAVRQKKSLQGADLRGASLIDAYLQGADLQGADLQEADLQGTDLQWAKAQEADLRGANLHGTHLQGTKLQGTKLQGANLDFSCLSFSCGSRMPKTDQRQRVQLAHHLLSWIRYADDATEGEKAIFNALREYANQFHRTDVEKFAPIKMNEQ